MPIITLPFTYPAYKAALWRWWVSGIRFGEVRFESDLRTGSLMGLYWAAIGWTTLLVVADVIVLTVVITVAVLFGGKLVPLHSDYDSLVWASRRVAGCG